MAAVGAVRLKIEDAVPMPNPSESEVLVPDVQRTPSSSSPPKYRNAIWESYARTWSSKPPSRRWVTQGFFEAASRCCRLIPYIIINWRWLARLLGALLASLLLKKANVQGRESPNR